MGMKQLIGWAIVMGGVYFGYTYVSARLF